jgi:mannose-1-phosphate guanylyltransferase
MQVVILAGGVGSRMQPWTNSMPKPLLPMLDLTLLERVVEKIPATMVDEVIVAAGYKVEMIAEYFAKNDPGFDVTIVHEEKMLGTGGALKNCQDFISGRFACFNGDIVSSLPFEQMLTMHDASDGIGTLGLWEVEDPTRFGIVGLNDNGRITRFKEKPLPHEVFSNLINAGSYILEEDIFALMPDGKHSIERDVFPQLAEQGQLSGFPFKGWFIDAGTPASWQDAVSRCLSEGMFTSGSRKGSSWCANEVVDAENSMIEQGVSSAGSILDSTILSGSSIGKDSRITRCLIGRDCQIGKGVELVDVIVDHGENIADGYQQSGGTFPLPQQ